MKTKLVAFSAALLLSFGVAGTSLAKQGGGNSFSYDDVTLDGVKFMGVSASEFKFHTGNDNHVSMNDSDLFGGDEAYTQILKFDNPGDTTYSDSDNDYSFVVDATSWSGEQKEGSWGIDLKDLGLVDDKGLNAKIDLVVVLKAANAFTAYRFEDLSLTESTGFLEWQVQHKKKNVPALSHMTLYVRGYEFVPSNDEPGNGTSASEVPEPATLLLFGAGLASLAGVVRRKRQ